MLDPGDACTWDDKLVTRRKRCTGADTHTLTRSSLSHIVSISSSMLSHSFEEMGTESGILRSANAELQ